MKLALAITWFVILLAAHGWSQADPLQSNSQNPWHPTMNGESGSLAFSPETERANLLSGGMTFAGSYDDNALDTFRDHVGSLGYSVMPNLSLVEQRSRILFTLNYNPAFLWSQRSTVHNETGQTVDFTSQWRLTERLSARIHENFVDQNTEFNQLNEESLLSGGAVLNQPNPSTITPLAKTMTNASSLDLVYQIGEATNIGVTGTFNKLNFQDISTTSEPLFDNEAWSGQAFYSHHLSARHTLGVTYTFQKFATYGQILEHTRSQNVVLFYRVDFKPGVFFSVFAGPDHSIANDQFEYLLGPGSIPVNQTNSMWLADEGITFGWQGQRTSARMDLVHHVTDGGGLAGAVQLYSGTAGLRRRMSQTFTADLTLNYGDNDPLSHSYGNSTFVGEGGSVGVDRTMGAHFTAGVRYGRFSQRFEQFQTTTVRNFPADHNQAWFTLTYHFSRPLG